MTGDIRMTNPGKVLDSLAISGLFWLVNYA